MGHRLRSFGRWSLIVVTGAVCVLMLRSATDGQERVDRHPFFGPAESRIALSHQGIGGSASLEAFRAATSQGFEYLETDLRVSSDGVLFTHHALAFSTTNWSSFDRLDAEIGPLTTAEAMLTDPMLTDARWLFEINIGATTYVTKPGTDTTAQVVDAVARMVTDHPRAHVCFQFGRTIDESAFARLIDALPDDSCYCRTFWGRLVDAGYVGRFARHVADRRNAGAACDVFENGFVDADDVRQSHDHHKVYLAWFIAGENAERAARLAAAGVDGMIVADPTVLPEGFRPWEVAERPADPAVASA